jgi:hypothetical protein
MVDLFSTKRPDMDRWLCESEAVDIFVEVPVERDRPVVSSGEVADILQVEEQLNR